MKRSGHPGWVPTALEGLEKTIELAHKKGIKIVINGGALNPKGLAVKIQQIVCHSELTGRELSGVTQSVL